MVQNADMNVIVIYGSPAVGKLTVAKALARMTHYRVLHNHLTIDLVDAVINDRCKNYWRVLSRLRLLMIRVAMEHRIDIIVTGCYSHSAKPFYRKLVATVTKSNGSVHFVHLRCDETELFRRVRGKSRKRFGKTTSVLDLRRSIETFGHNVKMPFVYSLVIDNTRLSPTAVAALIADHYGLASINKVKMGEA